MSTTAALRISSIRHSYLAALKLNVDELALDEGTVLCLLGSSGAGKSTLLRIMALLERPESGSIEVGGRPATTRSLWARRRMAAALQSAPLWRGTASSNVEFALKARGVGRAERRVRSEESLAAVGLEGFGGREVTKLSGGQRQRVGLARTLALRPQILFLDEPLAHIDEPMRESLAMSLRRLTKEIGCATLWVTHDRSEALAVSDSLALIEGGSLVQVGNAMEVFSRPSGERAAKLVGADNLIPGRIEVNEEGLATIAVGAQRVTATTPIERGSQVLLLVRPEAITLSLEEPVGTSPRNRLQGEVQEVTFLGPLTKIAIASPIPLVALVTVATYEELGIGVGTKIWASFKATSAHVVRRA